MSGNCSISHNIPLAESTLSFLRDYEPLLIESKSDSKTIGGILSNSKYVWYANGPRFQIIESRTGRKVASWIFGSILKDTSTKVVCLCEIPCLSKDIPLLILGLECASTGGIICVFDILTSKVLRAIQVNEKVSYVHVIDCGSNIFPVLGPLKAFDGVVAVGLVGGDVLLIDLCQQCIDDARVSNSLEDIRGEIDLCQITPLTIKDIDDIENHKQRATQLGSHICIILNAVVNNRSPHFTLKGPKGEDRIHVNKAEVLVTALFYSSQLGSLLVGYNFGAWQIWNIISMRLIYTSPVYEENVPVSYFTVQEPADDPRAFCYVWAIYSYTEENHHGFPIAVLYSLNYEAKDFHEGYGYLYQDLHSCAVRFQRELTAVGDPSKITKGARCLRLTAFNKGCSSRTSIQESHEDTLTVCSMVWNVEHCNGIDTYISVFDLNQWYKEQMPNSPQQNSFSYLSNVCITDILNESMNNSHIMDVLIDESSINQFIGLQKPEEHYYPTALAYEFSICGDKNITFICNKGQQRALLSFFENTGPLLLLKPKQIFQQSIQLGLTPLFIDATQLDLTFQREFLLNIALEQQMTGFLCKCVSTWYNGSFTSMGCSLEFFLNWAWNRAILLKENADRLCETLFDYSEVCLDANNQRILNSCVSQLSNLYRVYGFMFKKLQLPLSNMDVVRQQQDCLHMIVTYLEVLQWLMNIGLLPEFSENTSKKDSISAPYPIKSLLEYYKERRSCMSKKVPFLYIDILIENEMGIVLSNFWKEDGGDGYYPPPSLQSLLRTYLIENVDVIQKHCIIVYLFLDLAMALDQSRYKFIVTHLIKFPTVFKLNPSITKITQAFWQLDHGDFGTAMDQFLDPLINVSDLKIWHHRIILNALFMQGQHSFALLYYQVRKPPLETTQDIFNILSLYIANRMIDEAISFRRLQSTQNNEERLIRHVFEECKSSNQILEFVYYPLNLQEEEVLMKYLEEVSFDSLEEFRISYYLHRSRYIDIFQMKNKDGTFQPSGLRGQKELGCCDDTMKAIASFFPKVTQDILDVYHFEKKISHNKVSRPKPMSVFVHNAEEKTKYKSTLIHAGILKAKEIWSHPVLEKSRSDDLPFIKTPIATMSESRKRSLIICPKVINSDSSDYNVGSPIKRMKFNPEAVADTLQSDVSEVNTPRVLDMSKLLTPIVKRKNIEERDCNKLESETFNTCTPQGILKVRNLVTPQSPSVITYSPNTSSRNISSPSSNSFGVLNVTPRKSLPRSVVRFEKMNESSLTDSLELPKNQNPAELPNLSKSPEISKSCSLSSETFYSPNTSGNNIEDDKQSTNILKENEITGNNRTNDNSELTTKIVGEMDTVPHINVLSPKGRCSYKDLTLELEDIDAQKVEGVESTKMTDVLNSAEMTPRKRNLSNRNSSKDPETQSLTSFSPRRTSLRISRRKSLTKTVSESNIHSFSSSQKVTEQQLLESSNGKCSVIDLSSVSSLASEELDHMFKDQSFSIPSISLSPMQYTASLETDTSGTSTKSEQPKSDSSNVVDMKNETKQESTRFRRSSLTIKGRKSLSRMVLERNACSMYTSTPHHSFIMETSKVETRNQYDNRTSIGDVSEMSSTAQQELDHMIDNQNFGIPHCSLSLNQSSLGNNTGKNDASSDLENETSIKDYKTENSQDIKQTKVDTYNLSKISRPSSRTSIRRNICARGEESDPKNRHIDNREKTSNEIEKESSQLSELNRTKDVVTTLDTAPDVYRDLAIQGQELIVLDNQHNDDAVTIESDLSQIKPDHDKQLGVSNQNADTELDVHRISNNFMPEGALFPVPTNKERVDNNYVSNETTLESDEFNDGHIEEDDIIEIQDSSSSNENSSRSTNYTENANVDESSAEIINTNPEEAYFKDVLESKEEVNMGIQKYEMFGEEDDLPDQLETSEQVDTDISFYLVHADQMSDNEHSEQNTNQYDQHINRSSPHQLEITTVTMEQENLQAFSNDLSVEKHVEFEETTTLINLPQKDKNDENTITEDKSLVASDEALTVVEEPSSRNLDIKQDVIFAQYIERKSPAHEKIDETHFFDNTSIETSNFEDITANDVFDVIDIEKTVHGNITTTDILDKSFTDVSTDIESASELSMEEKRTRYEEKKTQDRAEGLDIITEQEQGCSSDQENSIEPSHKMQLRKRKLSSTSVDSPTDRISRRRASSDGNTIPSTSFSKSESSKKPLKKSNLFEINENVLSSPRPRNRRCASVSECISHNEVESNLGSKRKNKKARSVTNLPVISEENQPNVNISEQGDKDEQSQIDELELYSTTRRLTRHQKNLLAKSKGKLHTGKRVHGDEFTEEAHASFHDDQNADISSSATTEGRGRIVTRRMSQESASSVVSNVNSISDAGSPKKRRNRSKTPQIESPTPGSMLRRGRSKSIDEVSVSSQVSKSSRTTRQSEVSESDNQSVASIRRSTRHRSKTPDIDLPSKTIGPSKKTLSKIPEEIDDDDESGNVMPAKGGKSKRK